MSNELGFTDSIISSFSSKDELTGHSFMQEVNLETTLKEKQVPEELKKYVEDGKLDASISLFVLDEENLQAYEEEIGVDYIELKKKDKITGIMSNKDIPKNE